MFRNARVRIHNIYQDSEYEGCMLITFSDIDNSPDMLVSYFSTGEDISWMIGKELYVHLAMAGEIRKTEERVQTDFLFPTGYFAIYELYGVLHQNEEDFDFYLEPCHALPFDIEYDILGPDMLRKYLGECVCLRGELSAYLYCETADEMAC